MISHQKVEKCIIEIVFHRLANQEKTLSQTHRDKHDYWKDQ